ncbi:MAG: YraN family protein [Muribaculaceae bacterium]|nr:YraN family protein [Muribaculaceae bacterium]
MSRHNTTGHDGEQLVADYLTARGYAIRERNWSVGHLELDIVATNGRWIAFVEVKTRESSADDPLTAMTPKKIDNIVKAANVYMSQLDLPLEPRFDVAAVTLTPDLRLEYIEDAFYPPLK